MPQHTNRGWENGERTTAGGEDDVQPLVKAPEKRKLWLSGVCFLLSVLFLVGVCVLLQRRDAMVKPGAAPVKILRPTVTSTPCSVWNSGPMA